MACIIIFTLLINKFHQSGTYIGAKMGTVAIGIGIGIGIGLGSVETVLHIFIEANFIGIRIGVGIGIGVGEWKHTITSVLPIAFCSNVICQCRRIDFGLSNMATLVFQWWEICSLVP